MKRSVVLLADDGRLLDFALDDGVAVTLGGGGSQRAVITEGAPVRVSYKPKGAGADLVSIDVEPQASGSKGETPAPSADPAADAARAARPDAGGASNAAPQRGGSAR